MGKIELEIFEDKLQNKSTENCNLSVLIGTDRLSYLVCDEAWQLLAFKSYRIPPASSFQGNAFQYISELLQLDKLLQKKYAAVRLGVVNQYATLIPERLFDEKEQTAYLINLLPIHENETLLNNKLEKPAARQLFKLPSDLYRLMQSYFPAGRILHAYTCLINGFLKLHEADAGNQVFANVRSDVLHIVVFNEGTLSFSNSFKFTDVKDFIYYVLMVYKQFGLNPNEQKLLLSGYIRRESEIYKLLYRYIRYVEFVPFPKEFLFGSNFISTVEEHTYFDLFQLALCE